MKKLIIVLILALMTGSAFASFTGNAAISFGYDLDSTDWGFENPTKTNYSFTFELDSSKGSSTGEGKLYAEIAATASAQIKQSNAAQTAANFTLTTKFSKANIVWVYTEENPIVFGILNAGTTSSYADHYELNTSNKPIVDSIKASSAFKGFTVKHYGWTLGFGANGNAEAEKFDIYTSIESKSFKFAEDAFSTQFKAYANFTEAKTLIGGSAKASFKQDKIAANANADVQFTSYADDAIDSTFFFEADADLTYDFLTVSAYATPGALTNTTLYAGDDAETLRFDAQIAAKYEIDSVTLIAKLGSYNLLIEDRTAYVYAEADYTAEKFTAWVSCEADFDFDASEVLTALLPEVGISTTELINNATLSLVWTGADFTAEDTIGSITATCKVAF